MGGSKCPFGSGQLRSAPSTRKSAPDAKQPALCPALHLRQTPIPCSAPATCRQSSVFRGVCLASGAPVILKRYSKTKMDGKADHKMRREVCRGPEREPAGLLPPLTALTGVTA